MKPLSFIKVAHNKAGGNFLIVNCIQFYLKSWKTGIIKLQNYRGLKLSPLIGWPHNFALRKSTEGAVRVVIFETVCSLLPGISGVYQSHILNSFWKEGHIWAANTDSTKLIVKIFTDSGGHCFTGEDRLNVAY